MTLEDFNKLGLEQRCDAIWEWGFFVSRSVSPELNKVLYSLNGFFAEMQIRVSDNSVADVKAFAKIDARLEGTYRITEDNPFVRLQA